MINFDIRNCTFNWHCRRDGEVCPADTNRCERKCYGDSDCKGDMICADLHQSKVCRNPQTFISYISNQSMECLENNKLFNPCKNNQMCLKGKCYNKSDLTFQDGDTFFQGVCLKRLFCLSDKDCNLGDGKSRVCINEKCIPVERLDKDMQDNIKFRGNICGWGHEFRFGSCRRQCNIYGNERYYCRKSGTACSKDFSICLPLNYIDNYKGEDGDMCRSDNDCHFPLKCSPDIHKCSKTGDKDILFSDLKFKRSSWEMEDIYKINNPSISTCQGGFSNTCRDGFRCWDGACRKECHPKYSFCPSYETCVEVPAFGNGVCVRDETTATLSTYFIGIGAGIVALIISIILYKYVLPRVFAKIKNPRGQQEIQASSALTTGSTDNTNNATTTSTIITTPPHLCRPLDRVPSSSPPLYSHQQV